MTSLGLRNLSGRARGLLLLALLSALLPARAQETAPGTPPPGRCVYQAEGPPPLPPAPGLPELLYPADLGRAGGFSTDFAPFYLPFDDPAAIAERMVGEEYRYSTSLGQGLGPGVNPFREWEEELAALHADDERAWWRLGQVAAFAFLFRGQELRPEALVQAALERPRWLDEELLAQLLLPELRRRLPADFVGLTPCEGTAAVDVAVLSSVSFDSVAPVEAMLLTAARNGLQAVVVADRGRVDGAQLARRVAERLQREGKLPAAFVVLPGETIETLGGQVLGLCLDQRVPERMTLRETVALIHRQGGLAYLAHPGEPGGARKLRDLPFDGYLMRAPLFELYRSSRLMEDPALADHLQLYGSFSRYASLVGLPCTLLEVPEVTPAALRAALAERRSAGASGLFLPLMGAVALPPVNAWLRTWDHFFVAHDQLELWLTRLLGADNCRLVTSWDEEVEGWMNLWGVPHGLQQLWEDDSPFLSFPALREVALEYGPVQVAYDFDADQVWLRAVLAW